MELSSRRLWNTKAIKVGMVVVTVLCAVSTLLTRNLLRTENHATTASTSLTVHKLYALEKVFCWSIPYVIFALLYVQLLILSLYYRTGRLALTALRLRQSLLTCPRLLMSVSSLWMSCISLAMLPSSFSPYCPPNITHASSMKLLVNPFPLNCQRLICFWWSSQLTTPRRIYQTHSMAAGKVWTLVVLEVCGEVLIGLKPSFIRPIALSPHDSMTGKPPPTSTSSFVRVCLQLNGIYPKKTWKK